MPIISVKLANTENCNLEKFNFDSLEIMESACFYYGYVDHKRIAVKACFKQSSFTCNYHNLYSIAPISISYVIFLALSMLLVT